MKNRKSAIVAFLLVAALLLGVGYAALSDTLTIKGTATVSTDTAKEVFNEDIYFSEVSAITKNGAALNDAGTTATITAEDGTGDEKDGGVITIADGVLATTGDYVEVTYTVLNNGDLDATVGAITIENSNTTYFTVTADWVDADQSLAPGETVKIHVKIQLVQTPTTDVAQEAQITIGFTATTTEVPNA